jgi:hypothetical protein
MKNAELIDATLLECRGVARDITYLSCFILTFHVILRILTNSGRIKYECNKVM